MVVLNLSHLQERMVGLSHKYLIIFLLFTLPYLGYSQNYLTTKAQPGDGISVLLNRFDLSAYPCNVDTFLKLNNLERTSYLILNKSYKLPINVFEYNGKSIRTTIGNNDYDLAVYIQQFNENAHEKGVRESDFREDKVLWVPLHVWNCNSNETKAINSDSTKSSTKVAETNNKESDEIEGPILRTETFPIFGEVYENTPIISEKLKGQVYYLISGHGGPDPGAIGKKDGHLLCEDEYAYDVTLRFARRLLQHSATVYVITRDKDGIRDEEFLENDKDETVWFNQSIPLNQVRRLRQRSSKINQLYYKHKKQGATIQRVVEIHIDSRYESQKVDIFFYYYPGSNVGKDLAQEMYRTIKSEYEEHQSNRGYRGVVRGRNLHTLRESKPPVVYIELGNITNEFDQKRLLIVNNRQAIANWLTQGIISKNGK